MKPSSIILFCYGILAFAFYYFALRHELDIGEKGSMQYYADSDTYIKIAKGDFDVDDLVAVGGNLLGPVFILHFFNLNNALICLFNITLFFVSYFLLIKNYKLSKRKLLLALLLSPVLFSSLLSVNKEIVSLLSVILMLTYYKNKNIFYFLVSLLFSVIVRWQLSVFLVVAFLIDSKLNIFKEKRGAAILALIVVISIIYPYNLALFDAVDSVAKFGADQTTEGSGLYTTFINIQNIYGGYILVVIPKTIHLFVGLLSRSYKMIGFTDFYNDIILVVQSFNSLVLLSLVIIRRKMKISNNAFFLACVYCAVFSLSPIYTPRYLFPVYILLAITLAMPKENREQQCQVKNI